MNRNHFHFIVNDNRLTINNRKTWERAEEILQQKNFSYTVYKTEYPGHAKQLATEILQTTTDETYIIVVGGDGTVHEVVNGAAPFKHARIACLPAGSGNDYANGIQHTKSLHEAIHLIDSTIETASIDVGEFKNDEEQRYFVNSIGMGIDAKIAQGVNKSNWKKTFQALKISKFIYVYFILKELFLFKPFTLHVHVDGVNKTYHKTWLVVVTNQAYFGGGLKISPHSSPTDGMLHMIVVHKIPRLLFLFVFITVFWGGHLSFKKWVDDIACRNVSIISDKHIPIQADGEIVTFQKTEISIQRAALQIVKNN